MIGISRCILAKRMATATVSVQVEIGADRSHLALPAMSSPGRAGDIQSSPRAGGAGRANSARLDGRAQVRLAHHRQVNKSPSARRTRDRSSTAIRRKSAYVKSSRRIQNFDQQLIEFAYSGAATANRRLSAH